MEPRVSAPLHQHEQQATGQSVGAPNVRSLLLDNSMLRTATAAQFITKFNCTVSEKEKTVVITTNFIKSLEAK
jgi:hypothetical protein